MARGRFGRKRSSGANLTQLIASLYQQQRAAEDRVMFDAYQNGGKGLDGKPVTDGVMRKYIAGRRDGFSKDDPLYSEWNNRLTQLDFKIGEDKVTLAYQQGKVGAGAVAAFYRHQLSTIPQDSEFYRTVAGRAAQWAKAAVGAARGAARGRLTAALDAKIGKADQTQYNFNSLNAIITDAAKRAGLIAGNQTLTDADATDLEAFLKRGVAGPNGHTITFADWQQAAVDNYKAFDTKIAANLQAGRGVKTLISQKQKFLDQTLVRINTIDPRAQYEVARDTFNQAVSDAKGDPRAILDAVASYQQTLLTVGQKAAAQAGYSEADPEFIGGINNELNALNGKSAGPTVADLQSTTGEGVTTMDSESTTASVVTATNQAQALADGTAFYGQDKFGGDFHIINYPTGANLDPSGRKGLDNSFQPALINIDGKPTQVMLKGQEVNSTGLVDRNKQPVESVTLDGKNIPVSNLTSQQIDYLLANGYEQSPNTNTIGYVFSQGGQQTFAVKNPDGSLTYTTDNPFIGLNGDVGGGKPLTVFTTATLDSNGNPTAGQVQLNLNPTNTSSFLADPGVSSKDLLSLITNETPQADAIALQTEAVKRQQDQENYLLPAAQRSNVQAPTNPLSDAVKGLYGALDFIRNATGLPTAGTINPTPPDLGGLSPMKMPGLPKIGNQTPPTFQQPAPTPAPNPDLGVNTPIPIGYTGPLPGGAKPNQEQGGYVDPNTVMAKPPAPPPPPKKNPGGVIYS